MPEPESDACGAYVVLETYEGMERALRWCDRTDGPCPYPNAITSKEHGAPKCADTPGRILNIVYADELIRRARDALRGWNAGCGAVEHDDEPVLIAIDALTACLGETP